MKSEYKISLLIVSILFIFYKISAADGECSLDMGLAQKCCPILRFSDEDGGCYDSLKGSKEPTVEDAVCAMECYFKEHLGFKNYSFDPSSVAKFLDQQYPKKGDKKLMDKVKTLYDLCEEEIKAKSVLADESQKFATDCSIFPMMFKQCIIYESVVHCPKANFKKAKKCSDLSKNFKKCPFLKAFNRSMDLQDYE